MAYESAAVPIKLGYLFDFVLPDGFPKEMRADLTDSFELVFEEGLEQGLIDRPVEIVFREVEGLPKGSVKAVIDAYNVKSGVPAPPPSATPPKPSTSTAPRVPTKTAPATHPPTQ